MSVWILSFSSSFMAHGEPLGLSALCDEVSSKRFEAYMASKGEVN
jgi:hypothetical protein